MRVDMSYKPHYRYKPPIWPSLIWAYDAVCCLFGIGRSFRLRILESVDLRGEDTVLDVGCGTGVLLALLKGTRPGVHVVGIDPDQKALEIAGKRLHGHENVELIRAFAESLPRADESVDVCLSTFALHHMPGETKQKAVREMHRVLKKGGRS